jgi:ABC-2 type transport system ATP-binding protein
VGVLRTPTHPRILAQLLNFYEYGFPIHELTGAFVVNEIIQVENLTKIYPAEKLRPPLRAVDGIDFTVRRGEVFGFLGPNGAGKTSTIRMLTGLTRPTSGRATLLGLDLASDVARIKKRIGVVPEASNMYDELSAFDNLIFAMQLYGLPRVERRPRAAALLERFRLSEKQDVPFSKLSRGMKRALTIAAALAHRPPLVFLDEPTTGLDVISARNLRGMIAGLRDEGVTVFLTTHYLEEAERLCDRIAILVKGRIVALDTVDGLKSAVQETQRITVELTLANGDAGTTIRRIEAEDAESAVQLALSQVNGGRILALNTLRPTLEEIFIKLTGLNPEVMLAEKNGKGGGYAGIDPAFRDQLHRSHCHRLRAAYRLTGAPAVGAGTSSRTAGRQAAGRYDFWVRGDPGGVGHIHSCVLLWRNQLADAGVGIIAFGNGIFGVRGVRLRRRAGGFRGADTGKFHPFPDDVPGRGLRAVSLHACLVSSHRPPAAADL